MHVVSVNKLICSFLVDMVIFALVWYHGGEI